MRPDFRGLYRWTRPQTFSTITHGDRREGGVFCGRGERSSLIDALSYAKGEKVFWRHRPHHRGTSESRASLHLGSASARPLLGTFLRDRTPRAAAWARGWTTDGSLDTEAPWKRRATHKGTLGDCSSHPFVGYLQRNVPALRIRAEPLSVKDRPTLDLSVRRRPP